MRRISAWVAIAVVPTMIAGIYGMNFDNMPELQHPFGYPLVLIGMLVVCSGMYVFFRKRDWL
jgi:magnesium transporter